MKMMNVSDEELLNDKQQTSKSMKSTTNYNVNSSTTSQKRPMNAFLIFCKRHRSVVKQKYPHLENRSITKILGEWWAKISHQDKQKYTELARQYKEAFLKANPGFKWYKSDIKIDMQSCSPPSYVSSFTNNTTTINNTNASLNCNLFNNGNYQSDNDNTQKQSNGSNMTNQSDLNSHISTNKNDKLINNNEKPIDKTNNNFAMTNTSNNNSTNNNLTPKPPKKRYLDYLENGEFKEPATQTSTNSTNINSNLLASTSSIKNNNDCKTTVSTTVKATTINETSDNNLHGSKNYAPCGGPPVLDIETMNRVIENAFGPAEESNTITTNKKSFCKTSTNNKKTDSHSNLFSSTNRKNQLNKDNTKQQENLSSSNKTSTTDNELKLNADLRCNEKFNDSNEQFDKTIDKESRSNSPINSAIVDKFINANNSPSASSLDKDKLNNKNKLNNKQNNSKFNDNDNESNDKPLNLSSTTTVKKSQQVLIDNLIEKFLSNGAEGNPMPIEMLQNSTSYTSSSSKQNAQRKQERSCKGKRYLEMLNENQMRTKRNKSASNSSICNNGDELNNKNQTSSKWVSGNFDLEEKIRDFEEINFDLEEHDLKNVLDSSKTNSDKNETSSSFSTLSQVTNDQPNNILLNNNEHNKKNLTSSSSSSSSNIKIENNKTNTFTDKQSTENLNENRKLDSQLSNSSADLAEKIVERLNLNSQTLECNGLVALAAAAEAASSVPPSCT